MASNLVSDAPKKRRKYTGYVGAKSPDEVKLEESSMPPYNEEFMPTGNPLRRHQSVEHSLMRDRYRKKKDDEGKRKKLRKFNQ